MTYETSKQNNNTNEGNVFVKKDKINLEKDDIYLNNVAKIGNSAKNINVINNVLSQEDYKKLLDFVMNTDPNLWTTQPWGTDILYSSTMPEQIVEILVKIFEIALKKSKDNYNVDIADFYKNDVHLIKWEKGHSMQPHVDILSQRSDHIAAIYYINDDYEGGEINFIDHNVKIKPKSNSLVMFPGNENYLHEVLEVLDGNRYTSTLWFQFAGSTFLGRVEK